MSSYSRFSILDEVFQARKFFGSCHSNLAWGFINTLLAIIIYLEISFGSFVSSIDDAAPYLKIWYLVFGIQTLLVVNIAYHFIKYVRVQSFKPVELSVTEKKLCRISENEGGFRMAATPPSVRNDIKHFMAGPNFSPSQYHSILASPSSPYDNTWNASYQRGLDSSIGSRSPYAFNPLEKDEYLLGLSPNSSFRSATENDSIMSQESLKSFIHQQTETELRLRRVEQAFEKSYSAKYSMDMSAECFPNRFQYQLARHTPQIQSVNSDVSQDFTGSHSPAESDIWSKLNVSQDLIDLWIERLRKYLGQTVLARLSESIESTNKALVSAGHEDVQIGYVNMTTLKHLAATKSHLLPQLPTLIPFLEASTNQEYLVQRIKDLSSGGCISSFRWSSGGEFRGKKWEENLPTDSALIMHFLCCYMDSRLPPHPKHLDGKQFTSQHFFKASEKPNVPELKESTYFHEVSTHPPHYDIISDGTTIHLKKGRLNLFHSILLFFYLIKIKEHGMLRRVSLGLSGINILWIFDD